MTPTDSSPWEATFAFVDLSGFTALTDIHGDVQAVAVVDDFDAAVAAALGPADSLIKTIGDGVLIAFADPDAAIEGTQRVFDQVAHVPGLPVPRAGLHHGTAMRRGGEVIGAAVNIASRVARQAQAGETIATAAVAAAARRRGIPVEARGPVRLRGVSEPIELHHLALCPIRDEFTIDPVCHMQVPRSSPSIQDEDRWFCSTDCAAAFQTRHRS